MERSRIIEMAGAFLLGGGIVAVGYELTVSETTPDPVPTPAAGAAEVTSTRSVEVPAGPPEPAAPPALPAWRTPDVEGSYAAFPPLFGDPVALETADEAAFPRHGLVTSLAAIVRDRADLRSPILGVLRGGTRVRVDAERTFGGGCGEGWHRIHPRGWVCRAAGLVVGDEPPSDAVVDVVQPELDSPLPYSYWRVKDEMTPFFHRLPSFGEQAQADRAGQAWFSEHSREPMPQAAAERPKEVPAVVKEYMNAGYYVTKAGEAIRSERHFLRTMRGAYARQYQLLPKQAPTFRGQVLDNADALPLYFVRRELPLLARREGSGALVETETTLDRLTTYPFVREVRVGPNPYYEDAEGRVVRAYAIAKAYRLKRPPGVGAAERWIHIDLSEQTLVAYEGDTPVFATLVSTGKHEGMTPAGIHRIQIKHVATPMRDQPVEDEAYSIDDVPWTQYFSGSIALHGAFWHAGFGLPRSHGCVNLSPADARWLFGFTAPSLPADWHAIAPLGRDEKGSAVVVTP